MNFTSDNAAPACAEVMQHLLDCNDGNCMAFEQDPISRGLPDKLNDIFSTKVNVFPVITGSAANSLALAAMSAPYEAILCHEEAHIHTDECGAPEMYTHGAKLMLLSGDHGKIDPQSLRDELAHIRWGQTHYVQPSILSLTQGTEAGTVYTLEEIAALCDIAHCSGLKVHMDGARLSNAVSYLGCELADTTWRVGIDILCWGATKNGALAAELIVVFDQQYSEKLRYLRKRSGHFLAKSRFLSIQLEAYIRDSLWLRNAQHANNCARRLAQGLQHIPEIELLHPVEMNELFVKMPDSFVDRLEACGFQIYRDWRTWPSRHHRMVTAFNTRTADIDLLVSTLANCGD